MAYQMNFNRSNLMALPPAKSRYRNEYRDISEPGLYLHVTRHGIKTFFLYRKHQGKPIRIKIGRFPDVSTTQAKKKAQELKGGLALGHIELPSEKRKREKSKALLKDVIEEFFKVRQLKPSTVATYRDCLKHFDDWKVKPTSDITKQDVTKRHRYLAENSGSGMADGSMRTLRTIFEFYKDRYDFTGDNPVKTLSVNRLWKTGISTRRTRHIHRKELPAWFKFVDELSNKTWRDYLLFVLFTGVRRSEAENLRWENVNFAEELFTIPDTKNGDPLTLPLNSFLKEMLSRRHNEGKGQWVFPLEGNTKKSINAEGLCRRIVPYSGFEFSIHDLRRTFSTLAESLDLTPLTIKRLMNHRPSGDVTEGYIIRDVDRLREPSERIAQLILGIVGGEL